MAVDAKLDILENTCHQRCSRPRRDDCCLGACFDRYQSKRRQQQPAYNNQTIDVDLPIRYASWWEGITTFRRKVCDRRYLCLLRQRKDSIQLLRKECPLIVSGYLYCSNKDSGCKANMGRYINIILSSSEKVWMGHCRSDCCTLKSVLL